MYDFVSAYVECCFMSDSIPIKNTSAADLLEWCTKLLDIVICSPKMLENFDIPELSAAIIFCSSNLLNETEAVTSPLLVWRMKIFNFSHQLLQVSNIAEEPEHKIKACAKKLLSEFLGKENVAPPIGTSKPHTEQKPRVPLAALPNIRKK